MNEANLADSLTLKIKIAIVNIMSIFLQNNYQEDFYYLECKILVFQKAFTRALLVSVSFLVNSVVKNSGQVFSKHQFTKFLR
ncbi:hypothetical protein CV657_05525 [Borreliella burgdorferi]|uniref:Uncharacterized protein n=2 Tax=Borreliella burgdorferi TaxID=139 RepID=O50694_BORBU|nr:hypothetical protein [Borreliella burgdorferi]AAC66012.2 conserved hypothetical protein [Borreliella burgdorferi B31]ADQ44390.1 conserved hypothetical protein [Borreliella burgdorferi 297]MCD2380028.1 hypothetical protein [Borreliella burgdorferi]MCD2390294.1 hypothetical protein [Borreliella burgdorferi]MDO7256886.1 hypothetical protein [Borreliella burgdorferi]